MIFRSHHHFRFYTLKTSQSLSHATPSAIMECEEFQQFLTLGEELLRSNIRNLYTKVISNRHTNDKFTALRTYPYNKYIFRVAYVHILPQSSYARTSSRKFLIINEQRPRWPSYTQYSNNNRTSKLSLVRLTHPLNF